MSVHFRAKLVLRSDEDRAGVELFSLGMSYDEAVETGARVKALLPAGTQAEISTVDRRGFTVTERNKGGRRTRL